MAVIHVLLKVLLSEDILKKSECEDWKQVYNYLYHLQTLFFQKRFLRLEMSKSHAIICVNEKENFHQVD